MVLFNSQNCRNNAVQSRTEPVVNYQPHQAMTSDVRTCQAISSSGFSNLLRGHWNLFCHLTYLDTRASPETENWSPCGRSLIRLGELHDFYGQMPIANAIKKKGLYPIMIIVFNIRYRSRSNQVKDI